MNERQSQRRRRIDRTLIVLSLLVLGFSWLLDHQGTERLSFCLGELRLTLPHVCAVRATTGLPCATCGMTRSFAACAHGEPGLGFDFHPLGPALFLLLILQIGFRLLALRESSEAFARRALNKCLWGFVGILLLSGLLWPFRLWAAYRAS